jgi:hypothetical protein
MPKKPPTPMDARAFFRHDFGSCLFPMNTNLLVMTHHHAALKTFVASVLSDDPTHLGYNFLPQARVHAAKPRNHLRRTVLLDPVASYFVYDLVARNQLAFGKGGKDNRQSFGYTFGSKGPIAVSAAYRTFLKSTDSARSKYDHSISFDIASYFNSIYHHDATHWFASMPGVNGPDAQAFGRFFREINSGRSIDFLPQGIYPTKMIGSEFLRFVDLSGQVKSSLLLRFMDDIHLFDDDSRVLIQDFHRIQEILGMKGLNVNPTKTAMDATAQSIRTQASEIQEELAEIVEGKAPQIRYFGSGTDMSDFYDEEEAEPSLDDAHIQRLHQLLADPKADESDVELILGILHSNTEDVSEHIANLLSRFPNIVKQLHKLAGQVPEKEQLATELLQLLKSDGTLIEYQHFWIAVIAEDHLSATKCFGEILVKLYERTADQKTARAKLLEIPTQDFGFKEIRDEQLKTGASDWQSWAAAVGTRSLKKAERNYALKYFAKGSPLNYLIADCVQGLA